MRQIEILNEGGSCNETCLHVNVELYEGEQGKHLDEEHSSNQANEQI